MEFSYHTRMLPIFLLVSSFYFDLGTALDTITASQFIKDPETVSSNDTAFKLGFFSPENLTNCYIGIWYVNESNVIWVANRDQPLTDSSGIFTISEDRNLVVFSGSKHVVWSSNVSNIASNSTAQLLNSGNLVLLDDTTGNTLWESFQHPCNAYFPKLVISTNQITGKKVQLTSWKSPSDPSIGNFSASLKRLNIPEVFIWNQKQPFWRSGPWNGTVFLGVPTTKFLNFEYLRGFSVGYQDDGTVFLTYTVTMESCFGILVLNSRGTLVQTLWNNRQLIRTLAIQDSDCDIYGFCGQFGSCDPHSSPICTCLRGFEPRNAEEWNRQNLTSGCVRRASLQCERVRNYGGEAGKGDGFLKLQLMKVPDFGEKSSASQDQCQSQCLQNCSCVAYSYIPGIGCVTWSGNLIDLQHLSNNGADLHIRLAHSELDSERNMKVITTVAVIVGIVMIAAGTNFLWRCTAKHSGETDIVNQTIIGDLRLAKLQELPLFDFKILAAATNNFDSVNELGQGGFGLVYKGELTDGKKIAVKRLSAASGQGIEEFKNEVVVISKLQHRNLVRLLSCCIEGQEKMLIYEFMPNKSLDAFLFDPVKKKDLDWHTCFNIIEGISRGLLYLHRDSRLRIIHRDLKVSNILLDEELNPKISDFGMARIFIGSKDNANTQRIVGTFGYMSPEYVMQGLFSEKSDVFGFGVLILEIISGKKNASFHHDEESLSLLGYAWKLWNEDNITSLIDPEIHDPNFEKDILRCIHIGLLCVQELARDRPNMAAVVSMLKSEIVNLPPSGQVAFTRRQIVLEAESPQRSNMCSINNATVTNIFGR